MLPPSGAAEIPPRLCVKNGSYAGARGGTSATSHTRLRLPPLIGLDACHLALQRDI